MAERRARVRQHFIDNLEESRLVLDTKIDGFLAMTHLWAGEAVYHERAAADRLHLVPPGDRPGRERARLRHRELGRARSCPQVLSVNLGQARRPGLGLLRHVPVRAHRHDRRVRRQPARSSAAGSPACSKRYEAAEAFMAAPRPARRGDRPRHVRTALRPRRPEVDGAAGGVGGRDRGHLEAGPPRRRGGAPGLVGRPTPPVPVGLVG